MKKWRVRRMFGGKLKVGVAAAECLDIGNTSFILVNASTGRPAPPELIDQIVYEHNLLATGHQNSEVVDKVLLTPRIQADDTQEDGALFRVRVA